MTELGNLTCSVLVEEFTARGETLRKAQYRNVSFTLCRNEFRDVVMSVEYNSKKVVRHTLRDVLVHKNFVRDGKATVKLPKEKIQFMLSNCAPDKLIMFLKTMSTKLECLKHKGVVPDRLKLKSDLPRMFQEISPLTIGDLKTINEIKAKAAESSIDTITPKGKRKRVSDDRENELLRGVKMPRKLLANKDLSAASPTSIVNPVNLSKDQMSVLQAVKGGRNVFFTGSAGTGKSFLMRRIIGALPPNHTFATASTGVAACHIGGTTLHAFAGIGSGAAAIEQCVQLASRPQVAQQWKKCHHLIIDEISMVDGDLFDKLETVARIVRQKDEPFGGIQLIVCGDFLQLPPVTRGTEKRKFCFQSKSWMKCMQVNLELTQVRRQTDTHFIDILQNIRLGRCPDSVYDTLRSTAQHNIHREGILATRLCTHKDDVDKINKYHLKKLPGDAKRFIATDSDSVYLNQINALAPVPAELELRIGAQVMLAKNVEVTRGLVNGARGVVTRFDKGDGGYPVVKFMAGQEVTIRPVRWTFKGSAGLFFTRKQVPLKLAWAISIHKSQGMTLDCVEISLSKVFESGQAYVALSRAKNLEGLRVLDFDKKCVRSDPEVLRFYHKMELTQKMMQSDVKDFTLKRPKNW